MKYCGKIQRSGNDDFELGFDCNYNNLIYTLTYKINEEWQMGHVYKTKDIASNNIIVGLKVIANKKKNDKWTMEKNPLLNYNMKIDFVSDNWRGFKYDLIIYVMKFPE